MPKRIKPIAGDGDAGEMPADRPENRPRCNGLDDQIIQFADLGG